MELDLLVQRLRDKMVETVVYNTRSVDFRVVLMEVLVEEEVVGVAQVPV